MSGKRNVSVCRGHELANALYLATFIKKSLNSGGTVSEGMHIMCYTGTVLRINQRTNIDQRISNSKNALANYLHWI